MSAIAVTVMRFPHPQWPVTVINCYHIALVRYNGEPLTHQISHIDHATGHHDYVGWNKTEEAAIDRCRNLIEQGACQ